MKNAVSPLSCGCDMAPSVDYGKQVLDRVKCCQIATFNVRYDCDQSYPAVAQEALFHAGTENVNLLNFRLRT